MWEKVAAVSALLSMLISVVALLVASSGTDKSTAIATEALASARQANEIALGKLRASPIVEIFSSKDFYDFTSADELKEPMKVIISISNSGEVPIDGLRMELIGIEPFTYKDGEADIPIRSLPSIYFDGKIGTMILPNGLAHIDIRIAILQYLVNLEKILPEKNSSYRTTINIVLMPKAAGEALPTGVRSKDTRDDRMLVTVHFHPSILSSDLAKRLLSETENAHRVYSP
jgi:hypothetical protein